MTRKQDMADTISHIRETQGIIAMRVESMYKILEGNGKKGLKEMVTENRWFIILLFVILLSSLDPDSALATAFNTIVLRR